VLRQVRCRDLDPRADGPDGYSMVPRGRVSGSIDHMIRERQATVALVCFSRMTSLPWSKLAAWGLLVLRIRCWSYGSNSRQDDDLPEACPHRFGWSVVFQKAPPVNSLGQYA
jgi:hypothetical protein